ncbi:MAG: TusE/DsrC/DsvC family sulfur relay protein [Proteobacteria bacterium]|nr:TusE/DsrC/DsvC family sulfur relay protein [Pseudomonadota bacterium]
MDEVLHPGADRKQFDPDFPDAPREWQRSDAERVAAEEGINLNGEHWDVVCSLQAYYAAHEGGRINARQLHDALDEYFHQQGGIKYLYSLLPNGPVAQGCRLAGLQAPAGVADKGMGSAV